MSTTRAASRWRAPVGEQRLERGRSAACELLLVGLAGLDQHVEVAHGAEVAGDLLEPALVAGRPLLRRRRRRTPATPPAADASRRASRGAPRCPCPSRVPASRATIRARWNRSTLRPASARWSSARTPGVFGTMSRGGSGRRGLRRLGGASGLRLGRRRSRLGVGPPPRCLGRLRAAASSGASGRDRRPRSRDRRSARAPPASSTERASSAPLQLARSRAGHQLLDLAEQVRERLEHRLVALAELHLELREPLDDPPARRGPRRRRATARRPCRRSPYSRLPADLPDARRAPRARWSPAISTTTSRAALAGHAAGGGDGSAGALELLAAVGGAAVVLARLRPLSVMIVPPSLLAEPARVPGRGQRAVGRVDVAVLVEDVRRRPERRHSPASSSAASRRSPAPTLAHPVLELDLERPRRDPVRHARGSIEPAPTPGGRGMLGERGRRRGVLLEHGEGVDRARRGTGGPRSGSTSPSGCELPRPAVVGEHDLDDPRPSRACASWSSTGVTTSTRRSRLRSMRSAEPMYHSGRPPLPNIQIRECSRNSPTIERTRMCSDTPGQRPARGSTRRGRCRSMSTPALDASYSASMIWRVDERVDLEHDPAPGVPARACAASRSISSRNRTRSVIGATSSRRNTRWRERPVSTLNRSVTSAPSSSRQDRIPRSVYSRAVLRVVVAGADVEVAAEPRALAADDERDLRVRLEPDEAVHDVRAGLLEAAGPDDVVLLVEAGLDLDQDDDLLALLRRADQRPDDRGVAGRPVQRLLDRQDVGVVGGLVDEPLDRGRERLVRVVQEDVAGPHLGEHVDRLVLVRRQQAQRDDRGVGRRLEVRAVEVGELPQGGEVEHARRPRTRPRRGRRCP